MHSIITPVILLRPELEKSDYEYLCDLEYLDSPLVLLGSNAEYAYFRELYSERLERIKLVFLDTSSDSLNTEFSKAIITPYWIMATPQEIWGESILAQASDSLAHNTPNTIDLQYLLGFLSQDSTEVQYSQIAAPELSKKLRFNQLFDGVAWFHPLVKVVFATETTSELSLVPRVKTTWWGDYQSLVIEYLAALYTINNFTEPNVHYFPGSFLIPKIEEPSKVELQVIREAILSKEHVWKKNIWTSVYWNSLLFTKKFETTKK